MGPYKVSLVVMGPTLYFCFDATKAGIVAFVLLLAPRWKLLVATEDVAAQNPGVKKGVSKNRGKTPKMDGENNGKPYDQMDDLGGKPTIFGNIQNDGGFVAKFEDLQL